MLITSNGTTLEVTFGSPLSFQDAADPSHYLIQQSADAVPVAVQSVALRYTTVQSGLGFAVSDADSQVTRMVGSSGFSANATLIPGSALASMGGGSVFLAQPTVLNAAQALMGGTATLSANPNLPTAALVGGATLTATASVQIQVQATMAGTAGVVANSPLTSATLGGSSAFLAELTRVPSAFTRLFFPYGYTTPILVGDYISLQSDANYVPFAKILYVYSDGTLKLDREFYLMDPQNGNISWTHTSALEGVDLTINKPTNTKLYILSVLELQDLSGQLVTETQSFIASSAKPQVVSAEFLEQGQIIVTFSDPMRIDTTLQDPGEYSITGASTVQVKTVRTVSPTQVLLTTVGFDFGSYQLEVNATGTPHDIAGNPIDPVFNQAVFNASPALSSRSIFTDHGPITKPELTLQTGVSTVILNPTTLILNGASVTPSMVGLYVTLTGSSINNGTFRITARLSATQIRVVASFSLPDPANGVVTPPSPGTIGWRIFDPRDGQIADDPSDVVVRINTIPVTPTAVIGLLGQIVLPTVPLPTDTVDVDYCWICNPVVDFRRLNSSEFRLNNWNRDQGRPVDSTQHKYRYNNTLIRPETFVALDLLADVPQPLQRDLKYRAYERAYSVALNDPNLLLLNSPTHRIAFPPMSRQVSSTFVNYQATVLPEADPTNPWERHGTGSASIVGTDLVAVDASTGNPIFWARDIDLTFQHVFASAWRMQVTSFPVTQGVFTGIMSGYSDDSKAVIVGYLYDASEPLAANRKKIGFLKAGAGNDPSDISAWTGGLDSLGNSTGAPMILDWAILRSYRIFRDRSGNIRFYIDGSIVESLRALPEELPFLEELNAPFEQLQGVFFGSLSKEAKNTSTWSFVRYTAIPINPLEAAPSIYVSYEGTTPPEEASQPWTPVGFHGTETIISGDFLLLDSTSATDLPSSSSAGLISGDFKGFSRIEPLLAESFDTILDVDVALRTFTHGITPNAVLAAIDDGTRLIQLCFFPDKAAPKFSYGGRTLPDQFAPYLWNKTGGSTETMVGQYLEIEDTSVSDGLVYYLDDTVLPTDPNRVVGSNIDYVLEFKTQVLSYVPDMVGFCGIFSQVYDGARSVGILLEEVAGVRYVRFHSDGNVVGPQFPFEWFDGDFHTYRAVKNTGGDLVSLSIDGVFVGTLAYSSFFVPAVSAAQVSFGSATSLSVQAKSKVLWAYSNFWRINKTYALDPVYGYRRFAGLWKGYDSDSLTGYHLPLRTSGRGASVNGNVLADPAANFVVSGVVVDDQLVIDVGPNKGVYAVTSVTPTSISLLTAFPFQPSAVDYRIAYQTDWSIPHRYRISKDPSGGVVVLFDSDTQPLIQVGYNAIDLPASTLGIARTIAGNLPSILWGAFDPTNVSQTSWDYVRFGAVRSQSELGIVPHHQVLNQRNVIASFEHHTTNIVHPHTDFWSESEGIPPQTEPDLLRNPNLTAFTLLNDGTPLVPSTQTYEVRGPTATLISIVGLNRPEDVLNSQAFVLNNGTQEIKIVVPDDVLYNSLQVIETTTGDADLIAPFSDECQPDFGQDWHFQNTVCLTYDGSLLPEDPSLVTPTPWARTTEIAQGIASLTSGILVDGSAQFLLAGVQPLDTVEIQTTVAKGIYKVSLVLSATSLELESIPPDVPIAAYAVTTTSSSAAHQSATAFAGILTYGTDAVGTRTTYRNNSPLPDSIAMQTEVKFRLKVALDSTGGLGDSQVRVGFSSIGVTVGLAFVTSPIGERYVLAVDLNNGQTVGGIPFDFYDGLFHNYRLVRDPGTASIQIFIDS